MGKYYSGIEGSLSVDGTKVGKVRNWRLAGEVEPLDVTTLGDFAHTYSPGRQRYTGSCALFWYANGDDRIEGRSLIESILRTGAVDPIKRHRFALASDDLIYEFDALVTALETGSQAGDVMEASMSFQVCGPLVTANPGGR